MSQEFTINPSNWQPMVVRIKRGLGQPAKILKQIGWLLAAQAQRAFKDEQFGGYKWPARYPNQTAPKINVAGTLRDLKEGGRPKARRFEDRPVLRDTGILFKSINPNQSVKVNEGQAAVTVGVFGPAQQYAGVHQFGGESEIGIDHSTKVRLLGFLTTPKGKPFRKKLTFLFDLDVLRTKVNQRPFLGLTNDSIRDIKRIVEGTVPKASPESA